jgi:glycerol-3-phosphate acyltransferase PlsX
MGGDNAPSAIVSAAAIAAADLGVHIILVGQEDVIKAELAKPELAKINKGKAGGEISIIHAPDIIGTDESPTTAIRRKKESSIVVGVKAVKEGRASAFVSAGSTGALLTAATVHVGRKQGIERPALAALLPNRSGHTLLVDCGANVDCKPNYLLQFAQMGSEYMSRARGIKNPKIGLVNIGTEAEKGNALVKEVYGLLEEAKKQGALNFVGNIEAREVPMGAVDVAVCDAFVGNVILKHTEGLAKSILGIIKEELMADPLSKVGALVAKGAFGRIKKRFDYDEIGGAPFLGLKNLVVKAHGSSNERAIFGAIRQCVLYIGEGEHTNGI